MEKKVFDLEQTINKLVGSIDKPEEVISILRLISSHGRDENSSSCQQSVSDVNDINFLPVVVQNAKSRSIFGPSSVYNESLLLENELNVMSHNLRRPLIDDKSSGKSLFKFDPSNTQPPEDIKEAILLFFQYHYPSIFSFIHRESFLYYFLSGDYDNEFVSEGLVYAISALGSRMSQNMSLQSKSENFYNHARSLIFKFNDERCCTSLSSVTKMQTLLCLSIYDIGRGRLTSGWLLSGLAFRMGNDFGFELNPQDWQILNLNSDNEKNNGSLLNSNYPFNLHKVKSRIYWGCYIADNFISLVLGRPTSLKLSDTNMPESEDMGDLTNIEEYIYHNPKTKLIESAYPTIKALVELINLSNFALKSVFEPVSNSLSKALNAEYAKRLEKLHFYNSKLFKWRSKLPKEMQWNKQTLEQSCNNIVLHTVKCYFYIVLMCLNRPFVQLSVVLQENREESPVIICDNIVDEILVLVSTFKNFKNDRVVNISLVFCIFMSISILQIRFSSLNDPKEKQIIESKLIDLSHFLNHCANIWHVAIKPSEITNKRISIMCKDSNLHEYRSSYAINEDASEMVDPFLTFMENLFKSNSEELGGLSLLRSDLTNVDWDNFFDFDLNPSIDYA